MYVRSNSSFHIGTKCINKESFREKKKTRYLGMYAPIN